MTQPEPNPLTKGGPGKCELRAVTVFREGKRGSANVNGRDAEDISAALSSALTAADAGIADAANDIAEFPIAPEGRLWAKTRRGAMP